MTAYQDWIRDRRKALGLSQAELGEKMGVSQSVISQWEKGKASPSSEQAAALQKVLSAGQQSLLDAPPPPDTPPPSAPEEQDLSTAPKKRGRKAKLPPGEPATANTPTQATALASAPDIDRDKFFKMADLLRNNVDPSEYKHYVLGLIFLKYVSDAFALRQDELRAAMRDPENEDYYVPPEYLAEQESLILADRDAYKSAHVFWIPEVAFHNVILSKTERDELADPKAPEHRKEWQKATLKAAMDALEASTKPLGRSLWALIRDNASQPDIGNRLDHVMEAIESEQENRKALKGVLPKIYTGTQVNSENLGKLIGLLSDIDLADAESKSRDTLGRVYEYFLGRFASQEGRGGGEFYTPSSVVRLLVELLEPYKGRVYDPCCGSGGMFVQSAKFAVEHGGQRDDISVYGQESNLTTWRLCKMNLAIRGIEADLGPKHADTLHDNHHKDTRFEFVLANPPFNISEWNGESLREDARWTYGAPPVGNANFAWIQHIVHQLAPNGAAGVVMANGSMSSQQSGEGDIRKQMIEADLVDCMVALPGQLFFTTQIPACLWILSKNKRRPFRDKPVSQDRSHQVLFIDARKLGVMTDRTHRELTTEDIQRIADTYHAWRGEPSSTGSYADVLGFCKSAPLEELRKHNYVLTPGRYVGAQEQEDDGEPFEYKMKRLSAVLASQFEQSKNLEDAIRKNLRSLGF